MAFNPGIFKAYDIRGIYPTDLDEEIAYRTGQAYATLLQNENPGKQLQIVVSKDMRLSGPQIATALINGLLDSGVNVIDVGMGSTPTFYFAVAYYGYDGGIQVSASHNPKEYNGFKMVRARAVPVSGDTGINEIRDLVAKNCFTKADRKGTVTKKTGILEDEVREETNGTDLAVMNPLKVVHDAANSMGALDVKALQSKLKAAIIPLNYELDGSFPSHQPDPLVEENLIPLQKAVTEQRADLGVSTDGDGDRMCMVDEKGNIIRQEILRAIMAEIALKEHPGSTVAYDIRPGKITRDCIVAAGGRPILTRVGHSLIKEQMIKENAVFGGESSGHYFYKWPFGVFDSPMALLSKFLVFISLQNKPVSEIIKPYQRYFHSGEINTKVADPQAKIKGIMEKYHDGQISTLDGIFIEYPDFWFNVRSSNTEPLLRLNLEAISPDIMAQKRDEIIDFIRS